MRKILFLVLLLVLMSGCNSETDIEEKERLTGYSPNRGTITEEYESTDYNLDGYPIILLPSEWCDEWATSTTEIAGITYIYSNKCPSNGGENFILVGDDVVLLSVFIPDNYVYDEKDKDTLEYIGLVIE